MSRFDRGDVFLGTWKFDIDNDLASDFSSSSPMDIVSPILDGIAMASRFVFEVGEKKGVVDLTTADGPGVVEEIRKRCGWEAATTGL